MGDEVTLSILVFRYEMVRVMVRSGHNLTIQSPEACSGWKSMLSLLAPTFLQTKQDQLKETFLMFEEYDNEFKDLQVFKAMTSVCYILSR